MNLLKSSLLASAIFGLSSTISISYATESFDMSESSTVSAKTALFDTEDLANLSALVEAYKNYESRLLVISGDLSNPETPEIANRAMETATSILSEIERISGLAGIISIDAEAVDFIVHSKGISLRIQTEGVHESNEFFGEELSKYKTGEEISFSKFLSVASAAAVPLELILNTPQACVEAANLLQIACASGRCLWISIINEKVETKSTEERKQLRTTLQSAITVFNSTLTGDDDKCFLIHPQ